MNEPRRYRMVRIEQSSLAEICKPRSMTMRCLEGVPIDAQLRHVYADARTLSIELYFEHPSFEDVPSEQLVPTQRVTVAYEPVSCDL